MLLSQRKQSLCWQWLLLFLLAALPLDAFPSQQQRQQRLFRASNASWTPSGGGFQSEKDRSSKQRPFGVRRLLAFQHGRQPQTFDEGNDSAHQITTNDKEEAAFGQEKYSDADERRLIKISSQIELPFSAEVAYDAYSDLPRQPTWSSWLESVEILNSTTASSHNQKVQSKWTSKIMGIRYSWKAEAVRNDRPHTIQWKSVSGLRNEGIVKFAPQSSGTTLMTLQMNFVTPRAVTALVKRSKKLTKFVQETMIAQSLQEFKEVVQAETESKASKSSSSSSLF